MKHILEDNIRFLVNFLKNIYNRKVLLMAYWNTMPKKIRLQLKILYNNALLVALLASSKNNDIK